MKVSKLFSTTLTPVLFLLAEGNKNNLTQAAPLENTFQGKTFPGLERFQAFNLLTLANAKETKVPKYDISEVINSPRRIDRNKFHACYKVDLKEGKSVHIFQYVSGRTDSIFGISWDEKDKTKGLLFPEPAHNSKLVALVNAKKAGLNGVFEIYDSEGWYEAKYKFSPLLVVPEHTTVNSNFLINTESALRKLPEKYADNLFKQKVQVILGKNVEDSYYHYYPHMKEEDAQGGTWQNLNGRKNLNVPAIYDPIDKMVIIPQQYIEYKTNRIIDSSDLKEEILSMVFHELGHAFDASSEVTHSDTDRFEEIYEQDKKKLQGTIKSSSTYYNFRREAFAELTAALLGGLSKQKSETILSMFPRSAEYIREELLPQVGVNITIRDVRENIYPYYLKN
ncbi:MAG: hypothetical protein HY094_01135 [Candidatus Melainabacteria bacterium]|nr:hypothetical protein [Candidatus Melainabacteria bacterium]